MIWANTNFNDINLLKINSKKQLELINQNDSEFKFWLDKYKYFDRFPEQNQNYYFKKSSNYLLIINDILNKNYLMGEEIQLLDIAIFPFIRQFANVNPDLFSKRFPKIFTWYTKINNLNRFKNIMKKYDFWSNNHEPLIINLYQQ